MTKVAHNIRLPDGAVYTTWTEEVPDQQPVNKDAARSRAALEANRQAAARRSATSADLAKVGAAVVREQLARQEVIKELESAAERWDKAALDLPVGNELRDYYKTKAENARARAEELRKGKA